MSRTRSEAVSRVCMRSSDGRGSSPADGVWIPKKTCRPVRWRRLIAYAEPILISPMTHSSQRTWIAGSAEMNQPPLIEMRKASVMRGDRVVLHEIDLEIGVGEHVAILGPNGCGKSTLIRTLTRELYPLARPETVVRIFGQERWHVFELRKLLGIVGAVPHLSKVVTGREMVISGFFSSVGVWPNHHVEPDMIEQAEAVLAQLEASHLADRDFEELSSGEARRILIARALVHSPKALLLDEPSTSLDLFAQHEL